MTSRRIQQCRGRVRGGGRYRHRHRAEDQRANPGGTRHAGRRRSVVYTVPEQEQEQEQEAAGEGSSRALSTSRSRSRLHQQLCPEAFRFRSGLSCRSVFRGRLESGGSFGRWEGQGPRYFIFVGEFAWATSGR